jgi:hypothetical protein
MDYASEHLRVEPIGNHEQTVGRAVRVAGEQI